MLPKNWGGEGAIDFLRIEILMLAIEDEIIALDSQTDCGFLAQQKEGEDITILHTSSALTSEVLMVESSAPFLDT